MSFVQGPVYRSEEREPRKESLTVAFESPQAFLKDFSRLPLDILPAPTKETGSLIHFSAHEPRKQGLSPSVLDLPGSFEKDLGAIYIVGKQKSFLL